MRQSYTPIFRSVLTSRIWALSPAARCVWLWLELQADPEGYVCADLAGVAVGARVTAQEARDALEALSLPDADADAEDPYEGRLIERVPRGWLVLGFEDQRELSKAEARRARARRYMRANREAKSATANDVAPEGHGVPSVTPTKPKPKPKPKPIPSEDEGDSPLPPAARLQEAQGTRTVWRDLQGWTMGAGLRSEAVMAGVPPEDIDGYLVRLGNGPIGGTRGVFDRDDYVRSMFGKWRTWSEIDRSKRPQDTKQPDVKGLPKWVFKSHVELAKRLGLDLKQQAQQFARTHHIPPQCLNGGDAGVAFTAFMKKSAPMEAA